MMQYLVTVTNLANNDPTDTTNEMIRGALVNSLPWDLSVQVERYDPANEKDDLSKILAIKRIRGELGTSLTDSKFLTDTAEKLGESRWMNVRIYHSSRGFRVVIR